MNEQTNFGRAGFRVHHRPENSVDRIFADKGTTSGESLRSPAAKRRRSKVPETIRGSEARKVRTRSHLGYTGEVPMTRLGGKLVSAESLLEFDCLVVLDDVEPDIVDVTAQPFELLIPFGPKGASRWTPDFQVVHADGRQELIEVKTEKTLHPDDPEKRRIVLARVAAMRSAAAAAGYQFRILTEREIRVQPRLDNARLVHRAMSPFLSENNILQAAETLRALEETTSLHDFLAALPVGLQPYALILALRLERSGFVAFDRRLAIDSSSTFRRLR